MGALEDQIRPDVDSSFNTLSSSAPPDQLKPLTDSLMATCVEGHSTETEAKVMHMVASSTVEGEKKSMGHSFVAGVFDKATHVAWVGCMVLFWKLFIDRFLSDPRVREAARLNS